MKTIDAPTLASSAMLCNLSFSMWGDVRKDKQAGRQTAHSNQAEEESVKVSVNLLSKCAQLDAIKKFAGKARTEFRSKTLPWSDDGQRLVPTAVYFDLTQHVSEQQQQWSELVEEFLDVYEFECMAMQAKLGALYKPEKYPTVDELRSKFDMRVKFSPLPIAGDFRVDVGNTANEALRDQYRENFKLALEQAETHIWERLTPLLERMSTQLHDENGKAKRIYDSLVGNVEEMIEFMDVCNLTNDPKIARVQTELARALRGVTTDTLRNSASMRATTKEAIDAVIDNLPSLDM